MEKKKEIQEQTKKKESIGVITEQGFVAGKLGYAELTEEAKAKIEDKK